MARYLTDYKIVQDPKIQLIHDREREWSSVFDFPPGTIYDQRMIIQWWYKTNSGANDLLYSWSINGVELRRSQISGNKFGTYHEVFKAPFGLQHELRAAIHSGSGTVELSDVVIFFQREVE